MRYITAPKDYKAQIALDYNAADENDLVEVEINDELFFALAKTGLFERINNLTNSVIEDAEDESITDVSKLSEVLESDLFNPKNSTEAVASAMRKIEHIFRVAIRSKTGVYFFF